MGLIQKYGIEELKYLNDDCEDGQKSIDVIILYQFLNKKERESENILIKGKMVEGKFHGKNVK